MFSTLVVVLAVLGGSEAQLARGKRCQDEFRPDLTVEAFCKRVEHQECLEDSRGAFCACENGYEDELGTCRAQGCTGKIRGEAYTWMDYCKIFPNTRCLALPNVRPQCVCKDGFKKDAFGNCVAINCDDIIKGRSLTWTAKCQLDEMKCKNDKDQGPICIVSTCYDIKPGQTKTFKEICDAQKRNLVCVERKNGEPECECKVGFKNESNTCTAMSCTDVEKYQPTWEIICSLLGPGMECISPGQEGPRCECNNKFNKGPEENTCIPKTCNDMKKSGQTWKAYCETYNNKECRNNTQELEGPDCYCKNGYKQDGDTCIVETCADIPEGKNKTRKAVCEEVENRICVEIAGKIPECQCKNKFKDGTTGNCIPSNCKDRLLGQSVTYEDNCQIQKCAVSPKDGPICVVKTCKDSNDSSNLSYEQSCAKKPHMYCAEKEQSHPQCRCENRFKEGNQPYLCVAKTCNDERESGVTWNQFCEQDPNKFCLAHDSDGPQCRCKDGFKPDNIGHCEQVYCPALPIPHDASPGKNCSSVKAGDICEMSCVQGYDPKPTKHSCDSLGKWDNNVTSCVKIVNEAVCRELLPPDNGTVQGKCKNARPKSQCTFDCNPGYQMMSVAGISNELICTKMGIWSPLPEPFCVDKCSLPDNILMCKQDNAECRNNYSDDDDVTCECKSPYLVWKRGKGCQYQKYGYVFTFSGLKIASPVIPILMADSGNSRPELEEARWNLKFFIAMFQISEIDPESVRVLSLVPQGSTGRWKTETILFFSQPQHPDLVQFIFQNVPCEEMVTMDENGECILEEGVTLSTQDWQKIEFKNAEPACKSGYHRCPTGSKCIQDPSNPLSFTCECEKGFTTAHEVFHNDPFSFRTVVCIKESAGDGDQQTTGPETENSKGLVAGVAVLGTLLFIALLAIVALAYRLYRS